jgi:L-histidine N-alpha-methyltransferase
LRPHTQYGMCAAPVSPNGKSMKTSRLEVIEHEIEDQAEAFARDVRTGLSADAKRLSCRFLYDAEGSMHFERICELDEYYLTRAEAEIFEQQASEIVAPFEERPVLVELGSGSSTKTRLLIEALLQRHGELLYVPIDISLSILEQSAKELLDDYAGLSVRAVHGLYEDGVRVYSEMRDAPKLVLWLGSNIGNMTRSEAVAFMRFAGSELQEADRFLFGCDLVKDAEVLEAAYDDSEGVTEEFAKNALLRINRELGGEFDADAFDYVAEWCEDDQRVEMNLISKRAQRIRIAELGLDVPFAEGESVHVENSHKYTLSQIDQLVREAGLQPEAHWLDSDGHFSVQRVRR